MTEPAEITDEQYHKVAETKYAEPSNDNILVQDLVSREPGDVVDRISDGAWVQAWLWVSDDDARQHATSPVP